MGKTSKKFIEDIEGCLVAAELETNIYNKLRSQFENFTNSQLELLEEQITILNTKHGGDLKAAKTDQEYIAVTTKIERGDNIAETQVGVLNSHAVKIEDQLSDAETELIKFEKYVKLKETSTKVPWKKMSVSSSKSYIAKIKKTLSEVKRPKTISIYSE